HRGQLEHRPIPRFARSEQGIGTVPLHPRQHQVLAQLDLSADYVGQVAQDIHLVLSQFTGAFVDGAQRPDSETLAGADRHTGIEAEMRLTGDERVVTVVCKMAWAQKAMSLGVSLASRPARDLNHCRFSSTSDTNAMGTSSTRATSRVIRSSEASAGVSRISSSCSA
nr:hypothetical protein [Tanacetum cinerariifolium]